MKKLAVLVCMASVFLAGCGGDASMPSEDIREAQRVACVGDSITKGFGGYSYVDVLRGRDERVYENFGVCGTTALADGAPSYRESDAYKESLAWAGDVVVVMLGTNDTAYWQGSQAFIRAYTALVDTYLETGAEVLLCTPLAPAQGIQSNAYGVNPTVFEAVNEGVHHVAKARQLPVAEVYMESLGKDVTLEDGIHPNEKGAELIADCVQSALAGMMASDNK